MTTSTAACSLVIKHRYYSEPRRRTLSTAPRAASLTEFDSEELTNVIPFLLADIGEGIAEVEVLQWFVSPGDTVEQFDTVCQVQSDKATVDITSRFDGVVHSISSHNIIKVGEPLLNIQTHSNVIDTDNTFCQDTLVQGASPIEHEQIESPPSILESVKDHNKHNLSSQAKSLASPAVRKIAMDKQLNLAQIKGSGKDGRVLKSDIIEILDPRHPYDVSTEPSETASVNTVSIKGFSRSMVKTMTESLQIPHMCYSDEVDVRRIIKHRSLVDGVKLSVLPFAIKAASLALKEYPLLNSTLNADELSITYHEDHNIAIAIDSPRGLIVPVVKRCQDLSIIEIALELQRLKEAAASDLTSVEDMSGATFSLSNIGSIGGTYMSPVVVPPQVVIGAMGKIQRLPRFVGESMEVEEVHIMNISWGGDHRAIDGATLARFSNRWKSFMESPMTMVFNLK
eukprot:CAMPEP_0202451730 /NCGR_PEP_ID=MMETSP1360-20130828/10100_1 /ASSEMBLY_ACC=CAM_ASM_000848 /TAXON_ID=515479 /ORGANISM="Licmophora paradoxa, Strain CCMP2313" /LENGTH=453 /DNA_ID=CAMNT_0049070373 /DNA_START=127 /DNA_END=1488 /DNA_ORIENTATION=+